MKTKQPSEVFIDSILYVPAQSVQVANSRAIKIALLSKFCGDASGDSDQELDARFKHLYIDVTDSPNAKELDYLFTIDELINQITAATAADL